MKGHHLAYSKEEISWIRQHRHLPHRQGHARFQERFKRPDVSIVNYKSMCWRKGFHTGRTGCFPKGLIPWNRGKEMPFNPNSAKTQFKKGQYPPNAKALGYERLTKDGYVEISIAETNPHTGYGRRFVLKHKYLWQRINGPLPAGYCLKAVDGNRQNPDPYNWIAIPRGMLPLINGNRGPNYDHASPEVRPAILTLARLRYEMGKKAREQKKRGN
jgi:hypothetical protein